MRNSTVHAGTAAGLKLRFGEQAEHYLGTLHEAPGPIVIKLGGAAVRDGLSDAAGTVKTLTELGLPVALVHGGGPQIDDVLLSRGIQPVKVDGMRVTDSQTLSVVHEVLAAENRTIVQALIEMGVAAEPFVDGVFDAKLRQGPLGLVGEVNNVHTAKVLHQLEDGAVPVVASMNKLNINADEAGTALAVAINAHRYIGVTNAIGVLGRGDKLVHVINTKDGHSDELERLIVNGVIADGMIPKVRTMADCVVRLPQTSAGVITNIAGILPELFTHAGAGTLVREGDRVVRHTSIQALDQIHLRRMIEEGFSGTLDEGYFEALPESAEFFMIEKMYDGVAIVIPAPEESGPAYLDKIVVTPAAQGAGVGKELILSAIGAYPGGLYWRTRTSNEDQVNWYTKIADTTIRSSEWTIFSVGVDETNLPDCVQNAVSQPVTVNY